MSDSEEPTLSPADLAPPPLPDHLTMSERVAVWVDLMNTCEQFLLAGLRREIGPHGDLQAAYREWYARQMEEHDRMIFHMAEEFARRTKPKG
jgi:hypothetical protein